MRTSSENVLLFDCVFKTAVMLRAGPKAASRYLPLVTTSSRPGGRPRHQDQDAGPHRKWAKIPT